MTVSVQTIAERLCAGGVIPLFLGCRFDDQLTRSFARQIMKRSSDMHWAVLPDEPTRMEARFLEEQGITCIAMPLGGFAEALVDALQPALAA